MNKQILRNLILGATLSLMAFAGCNSPTDSKTAPSESLDASLLRGKAHSHDDESDQSHTCTKKNVDDATLSNEPLGVGCYSEKFVQPSSKQVNSLDILFVTDSSDSFDDSRALIADGLDGFMARLPHDVDAQFAVMLAHGSRSNHSGRLWKHGDNPYVLSSQELSAQKIEDHLSYNLTHVSSDRFSNGGTEGLYSFTRSLDQGPLTSSRAKGFFRKDAALVVIFLSNKNDFCGIDSTAKDCDGITPSSVLKKIKALQGDRPYFIGAVTQADSANSYVKLVQLADGIAIDNAEGGYREGLSQMGDIVSQRISLKSDFTLSHSVVEASTLQVKVDGNPVAFTYDADLNQVHISQLGSEGSTIEVSYCINGSSPSPLPSAEPSVEPTESPSPEPTVEPSSSPTVEPTPSPSVDPSPTPIVDPSPTATVEPSVDPTPTSTPSPSPTPTATSCSGPACGGGILGI